MKTIIETSVYLVIITFSCLIFIGFISMNQNINTVSEVTSYIQDYIEVNGISEKDDAGNYKLDDSTIGFINKKAADNGMAISYEYDSETETNAYYVIHVKYRLSMSVLLISNEHIYDAFACSPKET